MIENINSILELFRRQFKDTRMNVFDIDVQLETDHRVILNGKVMETQMVQALQAAIYGIYPAASVDISGLKVLVRKENQLRTVNTNLTGLFGGPSFQNEQLSQLIFGMQIEILEKLGDWGFVRQNDGYLGWMYLPYLTETYLPSPTHIVINPVALIHEQSDGNAPIRGRVFAGTPVVLEHLIGDWAFVETTVSGWVPFRSLRSIEDFPQTIAERRKMLEQDAKSFIGTPYEWGGCSANGIDCSGYAQLVYRLAGISIRRDADMQFIDGKKKESSFEPGDLVFFGEKNDGQDTITHVGISLGDGSIVHSSRARNGVYIDNIREVPHLRESILFGCSYF